MRRLFVAMLVLLLAVAAAPAAFAEEGNDTTTINIKMFGNTLMGSIVEHYYYEPGTAAQQSPARREECPNPGPVQITGETWTFTGQMNGQPASASGTWAGVWDGSSYIGEVTQFTSWNMGTLNEVSVAGKVIYPAGMPFPKPRVPLAISAKTGPGNSAWLFLGLRKLGELSSPLNLRGVGVDPGTGKIPPPCAGPRSFSLTNVAGAGAVSQLPRTGDLPGRLDFLAFAALVLGAGALLASRRLLRRAG